MDHLLIYGTGNGNRGHRSGLLDFTDKNIYYEAPFIE